jgi:hypothetical protein
MLPGTSTKPWDDSNFFCPADDPVRDQEEGTVRRGYYLIHEWRTVRRQVQAIRRHRADLTPADLERLEEAMTRVHGMLWRTTYPNAGPR